MPTKQKVALEIQILRSSDTRRTVEEIAQLELRLSELNVQIRQARKEGNTGVYTRLRVDADAVKTQMQGLNRELRQQKRDFEALSFAPGSYQQLSRELSNAKREFQALSREAREGIAGRDLLGRIKTLDGELKTIDASVGTYTRNVGNYASAFRALGPALAAVGIGVGLSELVQLGRQAVSTYAEFQQEIATLAAISGAAGEELAALERNAQRLGETTQFTATQVARLQTNFARAGLGAQQILDATEATINLSIATGEEAERASEIVATAINSFQLGAEQTGRIADVITEALNVSTLSLSNWAEAQKFAATAATSTGVSIEGTAAAMAVLTDAGLSGEQVGTSLRRIFLDLSNENSKLSKFLGISVKSTEDFTEAMDRLSKAQLDNATAYDLVGLQAQTGLTILANGGERIRQLTSDFEAAGGAAARTAAIVGDTLAQDINKARSAMEGLQINLVATANDGLRRTVQGFTALVDTVNRFVKVPVSEELERERVGLNNLVTALTLTNDNEQRRTELIEQIQAKYPEFLKNVDLETASNEELQTALAKVNEEYQVRILLQKLNEDVEKRAIRLQKQQARQAEEQVDFADALRRAREFLRDDTLSYEEALKRLEAAERRNLNVFTQGQVATTDAQRIAERLRAAYRQEAEAKERSAKAQDALNKAQDEQTKNLEILRQQYPEIVAAIDAINNTRADAAQTIEQEEEAITGIAESAGKTKAAAGSLAFYRQELERINKELDETPVTSAKYVDLVRSAETAQKALNEALRQRDLFTFKAEDFIGSPEDVDAAISALEAALASSAGLDLVKGQANLIDVDANIDALKKVEAQRIISLQRQLKAGLISEQEYERARVEISTQTEFAVLDARLASYEVGSTEYLQLVQERADKELEIEQDNAQRIAQTQQQLREQIQDVAIQSAGAIGNAIIQIEQNNLRAETDSRLAAIDEEYTARIEAAQGNAALVAQLEEEKERKIADVEREAARRRKEIAQKEAIIQTALAAIRTTANLGFPAAIPALIGQAIALAAQLATIDSQQFARGGKVRGKTHDQGGEAFTVRSTGQRVELEGGEAVINRRSMASKDKITVTGTPAQIASQINAYRGYGDHFAPVPSWVKPVKFDRGGVVFAAGGAVPQSPQFVNPNTVQGAMDLTLTLTDDQIDRIATRIADKTAKETGQAVKTSINDANRLGERQKFATAKTGIK